ncbi:hypothetical protein BSG1_01510 [Bacillus sp. SG-1]|nr:hypothetical protein BSG1_01510 [Bacillus sp. SG-1]
MSEAAISQVQQAAKIALEFRRTLQPSLQQAVNAINQVSRSIRTTIANSDIPAMMLKLAQGIQETEEDLKVFKAAIVDLGYPPHHELDIRLMREIARAYKANGKDAVNEYIDEFICKYYQPSLIQDIEKRWEKYKFLEKRLPLLRNAVKAHNLGMYELVVPSILSQFEGIIVDAFGIKGKVNGKIQEILYETLLIKEGFTGGFHFEEEIHNYYSTKVLVGFHHGKKVKSEISRHAILHGGDTNFGTQTSSLKVILLFDFIVEALNEMEQETIHLGMQRVKDYRVEINKRNRIRKGNRKPNHKHHHTSRNDIK